MAETTTIAATRQTSLVPGAPRSTNSPTKPPTPRENNSPASSQPRIPLHKVYALPAPIRTFPLPTFYPNNPISLIHLVYAWVQQVIRPPPAEPSVIHEGIWDPDTRSVHITDPKSIRALWEQGFYGKGSLSRSEPNWLKREQNRRGALQSARVSEQHTESRREERRLAKWERAKVELEAIERQRQEEATASIEGSEVILPREAVPEETILEKTPEEVEVVESIETEEPVSDGDHNGSRAPVTPIDLLALPNSSSVAVEKVSYFDPWEMSRAEATSLNGDSQSRAPGSPADILALPNSLADKLVRKKPNSNQPPVLPASNGHFESGAPVTPAGLLALPNSLAGLRAKQLSSKLSATQLNAWVGQPVADEYLTSVQFNGHFVGSLLNGHASTNGLINGTNGHDCEACPSSGIQTDSYETQLNENVASGLNGKMNGAVSSASSPQCNGSTVSPATPTKAPLPPKRRKSVRFSPQVESTTFQHTDPPSPNHSATIPAKRCPSPVADDNKTTVPAETRAPLPMTLDSPSASLTVPETTISVPLGDLVDKEHFQLAPEEAFFLVFALGALSVVDPVTRTPIRTDQLLNLFRSYSYFPPREVGSPVAGLQPSDPFLVQYAVYHHFRSLGWVPRHGIKFGVDFILYQRGPVFDHSEFGLIIIPAFSDPAWKDYDHETPKKSWSWLMGVNRVLSHVLKSLVLVYVDVPTPVVFDEEVRKGGIAGALKKYTIREVMVRRFSVNRNR